MLLGETITARDSALDALSQFASTRRRLFVLTGAGCSTDSGIPDYRNRDGQWKRKPPVHFPKFIGSELSRQRYWARSLIGWRRVAAALPNATHRALARLEELGFIRQLVTQNVDGLHQRAGSRRIIDLHGRIDRVRCLSCNARSSREAFQSRLCENNLRWLDHPAVTRPDGDAEIAEMDFGTFEVPACESCGGILKPDVVFFGENVPRHRVDEAFQSLEDSDGFLVVGSSLMVYSGYRFLNRARDVGLETAVVNLGRTRADGYWDLKIDAPCAEILPPMADRLKSEQCRAPEALE